VAGGMACMEVNINNKYGKESWGEVDWTMRAWLGQQVACKKLCGGSSTLQAET